MPTSIAEIREFCRTAREKCQHFSLGFDSDSIAYMARTMDAFYFPTSEGTRVLVAIDVPRFDTEPNQPTRLPWDDELDAKDAEIERVWELYNRAMQDRRDALSVTSKDGLLSSEWLLRTGVAERKLDEARDERDALRARVGELEAENADLTAANSKLTKDIQWMVEKAAQKSPSLDGYRELGQRAAEAENQRDAVLASNAKLVTIAKRVVTERTEEGEIPFAVLFELKIALAAMGGE